MELWQAMLLNAAKKHYGGIVKEDFEHLFEKECYVILDRIKAILADDVLDDKDCFDRIERMVSLFEEVGTDCASRHDFG